MTPGQRTGPQPGLRRPHWGHSQEPLRALLSLLEPSPQHSKAPSIYGKHGPVSWLVTAQGRDAREQAPGQSQDSKSWLLSPKPGDVDTSETKPELGHSERTWSNTPARANLVWDPQQQGKENPTKCLWLTTLSWRLLGQAWLPSAGILGSHLRASEVWEHLLARVKPAPTPTALLEVSTKALEEVGFFLLNLI